MKLAICTDCRRVDLCRSDHLDRPRAALCRLCVGKCETCDDCRGLTDDLYPIHDEHHVCGECYETYAECYECEDLYYDPDLTWIGDDRSVCDACLDECYSACDYCDKKFPNGEVHRIAGGDVYCTTCVEYHTTSCEGCDSLWPDNDSDAPEWIECVSEYLCADCRVYRDVTWCNECDEYHEGGSCVDGRIEPYSYSPAPEFYTSDRDKYDEAGLFIGVELEVEARGTGKRGEIPGYVSDVLGGRAYVKADSSLDNGAEIVTHPHSPAALVDLDWETLAARLTGGGFRSWDTATAGIHTHVSRSYLGTVGIAHFILTAYSNRRTLTLLAGRNSDRWARWEADGHQYATEYAEGKRHTTQGRYTAINLENTDTIEVRIWKGSLNPRRIRAYIEAVAAIAMYSRYLADNDPPYASHSLSAAIKHYEKATGRPASSLRQQLAISLRRPR